MKKFLKEAADNLIDYRLVCIQNFFFFCSFQALLIKKIDFTKSHSLHNKILYGSYIMVVFWL